MNTQEKTLPAHALAQYPNAEKNPAYAPKPVFA